MLGQGAVYVIDGSNIVDSNIADETRGRALSVFGIQMHVLTQGDEFDLVHRTPTLRSAKEIDDELGIDTEAGSDGDGKRDMAAAR